MKTTNECKNPNQKHFNINNKPIKSLLEMT